MKAVYISILSYVLCMPVYSQTVDFGNGKMCKINDIEVYYEVYGKGEPLLLLHGNRGYIGTFALQILEFSKYFEVIAMYSRGQGKTTDADTIITYELMARDAAALIDSLGYQSVYVLGWSDGANVGLELAKAHPEKIKRMVMFAGNYKIDDHSVLDSHLYANVKKQFINETNPTEWKLSNLLLHYPQLTPADLQKIKTPILVMAGENDLILDAHTREMQRHLPNSELLIAKGATHFMPWEDPITFNDVALRYLLDNKPVKTISGRVVDREGQALEYVNIGIMRENIGTMSFRNGLFELGIPYRVLTDTLIFSHVGFEPVKIPIANIDDYQTIEMYSHVYSITEVQITARQPRRRTIGITMHAPLVSMIAKDGNSEVAIFINPPKFPARVEKLNFHVKGIDNSSKADTLYFRINFYAVTDSMPGENIYGQNILFKHLTQFGWNELDLRPFNIVVTEDFFVSLQWLADLDKKPRKLSFGFVWMRPRKMYVRDTSFVPWQKIPGVAPSINVQVLF